MTMKMSVKMKNKLYRHNIHRPKPTHGHKYHKYKMHLNMMIICIKQHHATSEAQFMKKLSNAEVSNNSEGT